jgi:tape measure domain-containing protein
MISLGSINFGVTPDISRLQAAVDAVQRFGEVVSRTAASQAAGSKQAARALQNQEAATISAYKAARQLQDQMAKVGVPPQQLATTTNQLNGLVKAMTSGRLSSLEFQRAQERFDVGMSNSRRTLERYIQTEKARAAAVKAVSRETMDAAREQATAFRTAESNAVRAMETIGAVTRAQERFNTAMNRAKVPNNQRGNIAGDTNTSLSNVRAAFADPTSTRTDRARALQEYRDSLQRAQAALREYSDAHNHAGRSVSRFQAAIHTLSQTTVLYAGPLGGISTRLNTFGLLVGNLGGPLAIMTAGITTGSLAFTKLASSVIEVEKNLEKSTRTMAAITGSTVMAHNAQRDLMNIANQSGQSFQDLLDPYSRWLAVIKDTGLEGDRGKEAFAKLSGSMTLLGVSGEEARNAFLALQQMMSKGVVTSEELRKQFGNAMPAAMKVAADALGVTQDKLLKMVKNKEIAPDQFITKLADAYARFTGLDLTKPINGIVASQNRLENAWTNLLDAVEKNFHITDNFTKLLQWMTEVVSSAVGKLQSLREVFADIANGLNTTLIKGIRLFAEGLAFIGRLPFSAKFQEWSAASSKFADEWAARSAALQQSLRGTGQAFIEQIGPVQEYVKAQSNAKIQVKSTTDEYIKQQRALVDARRTAMEGAQEHAASFEKNARDGSDPIRYSKMLLDLKLRASAATDAYKDAYKTLSDLDKISQKPSTRPFSEPVKDEESAKAMETRAKRIAKAVREIMQETERYNIRIGEMGMGQDYLNRVKRSLDIKNEVDLWRDKMTDAGVASEMASKKLNELEESYRAVKQAELNMQLFKSPLQVLSDTFDQLSSGVDQFVDQLTRGELSWKSFGEIGRQIIADLMKDLTRLAIMNPLKNLLFGTESQTLSGSVNGGPGVGGLLGSLFSGKAFGASHGMAVTPGGFRFAGGGIMTSPTMLRSPVGPVLGGEAGAEAIMPLMRTSGGKLGVSAKLSAEQPDSSPIAVHFHGAPKGTRAEERRDSSSGGQRMDIFFDDFMASQVSKTGSRTQKAMAQTMGLKPKTIRRGFA